ncbi:hypothetical protein JOS77_16765 [Chromobacterium haemolyticum]|nr:hypothetical protein JOS77_16765 [Chromobacterium haemolyticum]
MKYENWADPFIIQCASECALADRLCKDLNAKDLWENLRKHKQFKISRSDLGGSAEYDYYIRCKRILSEVGRAVNVSQGEIKKRASHAADLARQLAGELAFQCETLMGANKAPELAYGDDFYISLMAPVEKISVFGAENVGLIKRMIFQGTECREVGANPFLVVEEAREVLDEHFSNECFARDPLVREWQQKWGISDEDWFDECFDAPDGADEDFPREVKLPLSKCQVSAQILVNAFDLTVIDVLRQLAADLDKYGASEFLVKKANIQGVAKQVFIRKMYQFHMEKYGRPLKDAIALMTTIALDLDPERPLNKDDIKI